MKRELIVKKCNSCGATVKILKNCNCENCGIICCGEKMNEMKPNSVDAAIEKHVPTYEIKDGKIFVKVNHVMEDDHYIEWVSIVSENKECTKYFKPGEDCETHFKYIPGSTLYAYCNRHGLWSKEVE